MTWIFPWVPKRLLSRATGLVMRFPLGPFSGLLVPIFAWAFKIDIAAAEHEPRFYKSFDAFFTRRLKPGLRSVHGAWVHPVDGTLTENGPVKAAELIQAKGWTYSLAEFLGDAELAQAYEGGTFMTYYLCPTDYHRVHAPHSGELVSATHIPGLLWPVNSWSVTSIRRLFNLNERVVLNFTSPEGRWSLVMVGATNVGHMTIALDPSIVTNRWMWHAPTSRTYDPTPSVAAGGEVGVFHLGSTVICIYESTFPKPPVFMRQAVKMGEAVL